MNGSSRTGFVHETNSTIPSIVLPFHSGLCQKGHKMSRCLRALWCDEVGFIISAELVLIATLLVIGLVVGLSEVQHAVVSELNDVGDSIGSLNQGFLFSGLSARKSDGGYKAHMNGSSFNDSVDTCDNNQGDIACDAPQNEGSKR